MGRAAKRKQIARDKPQEMALVVFQGRKLLVSKSDLPIYLESYRTLQSCKHLLPQQEGGYDGELKIFIQSSASPNQFDEFTVEAV